jgi:general secretion pathway protein E
MAEGKRPAEMLLGQILVRQMGLALAVLQQALDTQKQQGGKLGEILLRMKAVTEPQLTAALVEQMRRGPR